ncbi:hypothetical protein [Sphingomonas sp. PAMC 26605]|uniref:hypothetical protein n=1 Tax=Sphingomonas sp. PAMC 26605 TaxID=1112214 RepID=UPI00026CD689|nr:hypothetical protein [Sphingomonas sp. PAMC 26605]
MMKMHLVACVPNEGARRLANWVGRECRGDLHVAAWRLHVEAIQLSRLLDGSMLPGEILLTDLVWRTERAMTPLDWYRKAAGGWFDAIAERSAGMADAA